MNATVYTLESCPICKRLILFLVYSAQYKRIEIIDIMRAKDNDVMVRVHDEQDGVFPFFLANGERVTPADYVKAIAEWEAAGCPAGWAHEWVTRSAL